MELENAPIKMVIRYVCHRRVRGLCAGALEFEAEAEIFKAEEAVEF